MIKIFKKNKGDGLDIVKQTDKTLKSMLNFTKFANEFSRWISIVFVLIYVLTWGFGWLIYYITGQYPLDILNFVLEPTKLILAFYFGTKMCENISKGVCSYFNKKLDLNTENLEDE